MPALLTEREESSRLIRALEVSLLVLRTRETGCDDKEMGSYYRPVGGAASPRAGLLIAQKERLVLHKPFDQVSPIKKRRNERDERD